MVKQGTEIIASDLKVLLSIVGGVVHSTITCEQELKALPPMLVTEFGMVIDLRAEHRAKALPPMLFTPSGMVIEVRAEQLQKELSPMLVTESPIKTDVRW